MRNYLKFMELNTDFENNIVFIKACSKILWKFCQMYLNHLNLSRFLHVLTLNFHVYYCEFMW